MLVSKIMLDRDLPSQVREDVVNLSNRSLDLMVRPFAREQSGRLARILDPLEVRLAKRAKRFPTYPFITQHAGLDNLMFEAASGGGLKADYIQDVANGLMWIPGLDQLAHSKLPDTVARTLIEGGFGLWPINKGYNLACVDWSALGFGINQDQIDVLKAGDRIEPRSEVDSLWFKQKGLTAQNFKGAYLQLPTLGEVLGATESFRSHVGKFPHSDGNWLSTSSTIGIDLKKTYDSYFVNRDPMRLFLEAGLLSNGLRDYLNYLNVEGDYYKKDGFNSISKSGNTLTIKDYEDKTIFNYQADELGRGAKFFFKNGFDSWTLDKEGFRIADFQGTTEFKVPYGVIRQQVQEQIAKGQEYFNGRYFMPVVFKVDREKGIRVGVGYRGNEPRLSLAHDKVQVNVRDYLDSDLARQIANLPRLSNYKWPMMIPDAFGEDYVKHAVIPPVPYMQI